jgi:hypothetical protein
MEPMRSPLRLLIFEQWGLRKGALHGKRANAARKWSIQMKLSRILSLVALLGAFTIAASAAEIKGTLMDKMCSVKALKGGQTAANEHERSCALMPPCEKSGYGVYTADNRFLIFNAAGNAKALEALKASSKKDDLKVTIVGAIKGRTIEVASLKLD